MIAVQRRFRQRYGQAPPNANQIRRWYRMFEQKGCLDVVRVPKGVTYRTFIKSFINMHNLWNIRQRQTFIRYAKKRMKESLITGVPKIASSESTYRRAVKSLMFIFCTAGFFYQSYAFLESFLKYETIQNIRIEYPTKFTAPAITFCNKNRINRELLCSALPEECLWYKTVTDFCTAKPKLCNPLRSSRHQVLGVPRNMSYIYNISNDFLDAYGPQSAWDFLRHEMWNRCHFRRNGATVSCKVNDSMLIQAASNGLPYKCFTMYSLLDKPNEESRKFRLNDGYFFMLDMHPEQYMDSKDSVQIYMYVHDPHLLANPIAEGIALNAGYSYTFSFIMQQRQNLPPPYDTNCVDYVKKWEENGGRGPITKKDCIELCKIERIMEQYSCVGKSITYPHHFPICSKIVTISDKLVEECSSGCREACDATLYTIASENNEDFTYCRDAFAQGELHCRFASSKVALKFDRFYVRKIFVEPKYQNIEVFSYIGGFMGMWLGVCLVTFIDFLETLGDITTFAVKKWKKMHGMKRIRRRFPY